MGTASSRVFLYFFIHGISLRIMCYNEPIISTHLDSLTPPTPLRPSPWLPRQPFPPLCPRRSVVEAVAVVELFTCLGNGPKQRSFDTVFAHGVAAPQPSQASLAGGLRH